MATRISIGNHFATVDDGDADLVRSIEWMAVVKGECRYAASVHKVGGKHLFMHRLIIGADDDQDVDHRDGNGLNNVRTNLRACSRSQNLGNSRKHCKSASRFKGLYRKRDGKWIAQIRIRDRKIHGGTFSSEEDAARRYDELAREHYGEYCRVNFPREGELCALSN